MASGKTILLMGDSLSAGHGLENLEDSWPALLQQNLKTDYPNYTLVNDSISGETTSNGLFKLPASLERYQPSIVIIAYGGNDGLRGLDLTAMKVNLSKMIELSQQANAKVLLIGVRLPPNYGARYTQAFQDIYYDLAKQYDTALVPKMLLNVGGNPELMQADGLHPNEKGQPIILDNVFPGLEPLL
jgi:acyl-CoA thioesterase-1